MTKKGLERFRHQTRCRQLEEFEARRNSSDLWIRAIARRDYESYAGRPDFDDLLPGFAHTTTARACLERLSKITNWEARFLQDVACQRCLSQRQRAVLVGIFFRAVGR